MNTRCIHRIHSRIILAWSLTIIAGLLFSGCGKSGASASKFEGTYRIEKDKMTLVISPDHKGTMGVDGGTTGDITWEPAGDDKIDIGNYGSFFKTEDGNLRDNEGGVWIRSK